MPAEQRGERDEQAAELLFRQRRGRRLEVDGPERPPRPVGQRAVKRVALPADERIERADDVDDAHPERRVVEHWDEPDGVLLNADRIDRRRDELRSGLRGRRPRGRPERRPPRAGR